MSSDSIFGTFVYVSVTLPILLLEEIDLTVTEVLVEETIYRLELTSQLG